jgi:PilZ domain
MAERRGSPRVELRLECTLRRRTGSAIAGHTVEVGAGGMSVTTTRPLATDEVLHFDLPLAPGDVVDGQVRVLREVGYGVYALRFEGLHEPVRERLAAVAP